ncbi:MAG TPA: hypothetical protein PKA21_00205 [Kiritimatiellia bacterium]|nr:hypothetical protein [Kiritimatiellia bacterium]
MKVFRKMLVCCAPALWLAPTSFAQPDDGWVARTMTKLESMEFEFSRSESDIPFLPVLSLGHRVYGKTEFSRVEGDGDNLSFRSHQSSAYAALPLYIGERGLAVAIPYVGHTRFRFTEDARPDGEVTSYYLPVGAAWQSHPGTQWGWFVMPSVYSPLADDGEWVTSGMGGIVGRHLSGKQTTWYYGIVYDYGFSDGYVLPYVGFTYVIDPVWAITLLAPWPSVSYAPVDSFFVQLGVVPSGATWALEQTDTSDNVVASFGGWDLGVWANWRLAGSWWVAAGGGFSGLRSFAVDSEGDASFDQRLDREPWLGVTISMRPP